MILCLILESTLARADEPDRCASRFAGFAVKAALWLPRQQARYWKDVWSTRGRRLILVERTPRDKFNKSVLWDPFAYPATLPPEIFKTKFAPSAPASVVLSMPGLLLAYDWMDSQYIKEVEAEAQDTPGADYAIALNTLGMSAVNSGVMEALGGSTAASDLAHQLSNHRSALQRWLEPNGSWKELERLRQLRSLGILKSDAEAEELSRIARSVIASAAKTTKEGDFASRVNEEWEKAIQSNPYFEKRSDRDRLLMGLLFTPALNVTLARGSLSGKKYSDIELLDRIYTSKDQRFEILRNVVAQADPASLIQMSLQSLEAPDVVENKEARWKAFAPDAQTGMPSFAMRPDYPVIANSGLSFVGDARTARSQPIQEELDIWKIVWKDQRFSDIKSALQASKASESEALNAAINRIVSYTEINRIKLGASGVKDRQLCDLAGLGEAKDRANSMVAANVEMVVRQLQAGQARSASQLESCGVELAEFFVGAFQAESAVFDDAAKFKQFAESRRSRLQEIFERCPARERKCR